MSDERRTFLFMPESAYGPTNNCIGIGNELLKRGHRVVFAAERSWQGKLAALGFEEDLVDLAPAPEEAVEQDAGQFWKDYIKEISPEFRNTSRRRRGPPRSAGSPFRAARRWSCGTPARPP